MKNIDGVREVVQSLWEIHGTVKASALVDAARPSHSPAHGAFEWDNRKAGEQFRLIQARNYIRIVSIEVDGKEDRLVNIPRISSDDGEGDYKPISVVVNSPDEFELALDKCKKTLVAAKRALDELIEAAENSHNDYAPVVSLVSKSIELMENALEH